MTSRKRPGKFEEIVAEINQTIVGWINYFGIGYMKVFIKETQQWLNRRLRQLIWKRWKKIKTKYKRLRKYGISHVNAIKLASSRKGYWRLAFNPIIHQAISLERLGKWGLKDMNILYHTRYLKG